MNFSAKIIQNGRVKSIDKKIPSDVILSSFLVYIIKQSKKGFGLGNRFEYKAIAEEQATVHYKNNVYIQKKETYRGVKALKIFNSFAKEKFITYVTPKGDLLFANSPLQGISLEIVDSANKATEGMEFDPKKIKAVFGIIPKSKFNFKTAK